MRVNISRPQMHFCIWWRCKNYYSNVRIFIICSLYI